MYFGQFLEVIATDMIDLIRESCIYQGFAGVSIHLLVTPWRGNQVDSSCTKYSNLNNYSNSEELLEKPLIDAKASV